MRTYTLLIGAILTMFFYPFISIAQQNDIPESIRYQLVNDYSISKDQLPHLKLKDHYTTKHNQLEHYYFNQTEAGIEVYNAQLSFHLKDGILIHVNNDLVRSEASDYYNFGLTPTEAIKIAAEYLEISLSSEIDDVTEVIDLNGQQEEHPIKFISPSISSDEILVKPYLLPVNKMLIPVWNVGIYFKDHTHYWNLRIDANTGAVLDKNDYVIECNWGEGHSGHQHEMEIPGGTTNSTATSAATKGTNEYQVFAWPIESPNHGNRTIVSEPSDEASSPFGWHDIDGNAGAEFTFTGGNNVVAGEDKDADNNTEANPVDGGSGLSFLADFDISKSASNYTDAAIINLFYWNNIMHDVWHHYGFDEPSGNFQWNNYGNGGIEGDYVIAEAQDGGGYNNANFATFPDGVNGRMQMYLWGTIPGANLVVHSPTAIEGSYVIRQALFGSELGITPVSGELVLVEDTSASPSEGCFTITNESAVNGKIALLDRGNCTFTTKVKNAQEAGAIAAIVINNLNGAPFSMTGSDASITIPAVMLSKADGDVFKNELSKSNAVSISMYDSTELTFFRDSDFDNGVIAHEYGHGISVRLTGGPSNSGCLSNQEQMGEGWSDFFALVMTHEPGDSGSMKRGIGTYARGQGINGKGIRPYAYSTDTLINPTTYADVANPSFSVPHGVGSVWCQMIWDMYWAFIEEYGYDGDIYNGTGGNNIAMRLVIDGMKLQKCGPGFADARDAILLADKINNGGRNQLLIWTVFAKRGLGYSADQGSSASRSDGVEAFDIPADIFDPTIEKYADEVVKGGDERSYRFVVRNFSDKTIKNILIVDTLDNRLITRSLTDNCDWTYEGNVARFTIDSILPYDSFSCNLNVAVANERYSVISFEDDVESGGNFWVPVTETGVGGFTITSDKSHSGFSSWFIDNPGSKSDRFLTGEITLGAGNPAFGFYHYYNTEDGWDGAVVEIDTGSGWQDLGQDFIVNGYNNVIATNPASAISGRDAFTGSSNGFVFSAADLSNYADRTVSIRFRFTSDAAASGEGWYIDDIILFDTFEIIRNSVTMYPENFPSGKADVLSLLLEGTDPLGVRELNTDQGDIFIYPNPVNDILYIENSLSSGTEIQIHDVNGKILLSVRLDKGEKTEIDVSDLSGGVYFVKAVTLKNTVIKKVLIR